MPSTYKITHRNSQLTRADVLRLNRTTNDGDRVDLTLPLPGEHDTSTLDHDTRPASGQSICGAGDEDGPSGGYGVVDRPRGAWAVVGTVLALSVMGLAGGMAYLVHLVGLLFWAVCGGGGK